MDNKVNVRIINGNRSSASRSRDIKKKMQLVKSDIQNRKGRSELSICYYKRERKRFLPTPNWHYESNPIYIDVPSHSMKRSPCPPLLLNRLQLFFLYSFLSTSERKLFLKSRQSFFRKGSAREWDGTGDGIGFILSQNQG